MPITQEQGITYICVMMASEAHPYQEMPTGEKHLIHQDRNGSHFIVLPEEVQRMERGELIELYTPQNISAEDTNEYLLVIDKALRVHDDREKTRNGLWKQYPALDQLRQVKIKVERCIHLLEQGSKVAAEEVAQEVESECYDIINYANFAARRARPE